MASLLDIAPVTETVTVNGTKVTVTGVSAKGIAILLERFPEIRMMLVGKAVDPDKIMALIPDALPAIIAAGTGNPGDEAHEKKAASLPIEAQLEFLSAIMKVTMPNGPGPFVEKLTAIVQGVGAQ